MMGVSIATERRFLSENEYGRVFRSHYPDLQEISPDELLDLARWLRSQRDRARDIMRDRRRARRGKADTRSSGTDSTGDRGLASKKQVFASALKRVNARLDNLSAKKKRAEAAARLHDAVTRKHSQRVHHPRPDRRARTGMRPIESTKTKMLLQPAEIGRASQFVRNAQAAKDGRAS